MRKIRAIIKRPDERYGHMTNISPKLENLQKTVGGYIEVVTLNEDKGLLLICNEDGKNEGLPRNFKIPGDIIVGNVIILGRDGEEFTDIPIEFAEWKMYLDRVGKATVVGG